MKRVIKVIDKLFDVINAIPNSGKKIITIGVIGAVILQIAVVFLMNPIALTLIFSYVIYIGLRDRKRNSSPDSRTTD